MRIVYGDIGLEVERDGLRAERDRLQSEQGQLEADLLQLRVSVDFAPFVRYFVFDTFVHPKSSLT